MPTFLCEEIAEYMKMFYTMGETDRLFPVTKQ